MQTAEVETRKQLVGLLATHQRRILGYIHSLVPNVHDAEDIFQETCEVICEKFDEFRVGSDFAAWACTIAWWRVRAARTNFGRARVIFSDRVLELLSASAASLRDEVDARQEALARCIQRLPDRERRFILARYQPGAGVEAAARQSGRSLAAAYKALARLRKALFECVNARLAAGAAGVEGVQP